MVMSTSADLATPTPAPSTPYTVLGSIDVGTLENSIFLWKGVHYILENIGCGYIDHYGQWDPSFQNHSYARIRKLDSGEIVMNVSATVGYSFVSAFSDEYNGKMWLVGNGGDRCHVQCANGIQVFSSEDLLSWETAKISDTKTCNVEIARVESAPLSGPAHKYIMILEDLSFLLNNNEDGDLTHGWFSANVSKPTHAPGGGPSIRWENYYYYVISGGNTVSLTRSKDLKNWEGPKLMIHPTAADANIAPYAGFPAQASHKGFDSMQGHPEAWDFNSNDGDVCCHGGSQGAWLVWGASTQGKKPKPPAKHGCTNAIGYAPNMTLAQLLESFFPYPEVLV